MLYLMTISTRWPASLKTSLISTVMSGQPCLVRRNSSMLWTQMRTLILMSPLLSRMWHGKEGYGKQLSNGLLVSMMQQDKPCQLYPRVPPFPTLGSVGCSPMVPVWMLMSLWTYLHLLQGFKMSIRMMSRMLIQVTLVVLMEMISLQPLLGLKGAVAPPPPTHPFRPPWFTSSFWKQLCCSPTEGRGPWFNGT